MSIERKGVVAENWAFAADEAGIWLVAHEQSLALGTDQDEQFEAELLLHRHRVDPADIRVMPHGSSWRPGDGVLIVTMFTVLDAGEAPVFRRWPQARGVDEELLAYYGPPAPHFADAIAKPRLADIMQHALRHLAHLRLYDTPTFDVLPRSFHRPLGELQPALVEMFKRPVPDVAA